MAKTKEQTGVPRSTEGKGGLMAQECQCVARADDTDPERLALWKQVFPPDGKVPIMAAQHIGEGNVPYYLIDFDRVSSEQKASFIKERALKFKMSEEDMAAEIALVGAPTMATGIIIDWCPMHDPKKETPGAESPQQGKGGLTMSKRKRETAAQHLRAPGPPPPPPPPPALVGLHSQPKLLRTEKRQLPHKLTDEELRTHSMQLALTFNEISLEEARQAQVKEELKATMTQLVSKQRALAKAVQTGEELTTVDVDILLLPGDEIVSELRKDTGQLVNTRPATDFERQGHMFSDSEEDLFGEKGGKDKDK